ncbi:hypothetical protein GeomeDRAFT_0547 [Geobacter metallireducens RCH3]|nr:hypothetical protein GeomeDRAFT_0547 [Geobacter metallireducens RCH3]
MHKMVWWVYRGEKRVECSTPPDEKQSDEDYRERDAAFEEDSRQSGHKESRKELVREYDTKMVGRGKAAHHAEEWNKKGPSGHSGP